MKPLPIPPYGCARCGRKREPFILTRDGKTCRVKRWCEVPCSTSYEPIKRRSRRGT